MASSSRTQVLNLYKVLLRESQKFNSYNYRTYAIRRVRDAFREKKNVDDFHEIQSLIYRAKENLEVIQRQQRGGLQTPIINFIIYCVQKKGIFYLLVDTNTGFYWSCDFHNAIRLQLGNCTPLTS
ncbi:LYR motif-containing protein 4 isoform X1 [Dendrobates tinctorius]|uniref:LYR motif-containing protein 4 isoform X1 n=1 Tax=Dendrobates tinctorius TaxID=92724 RepID=UPI003CC9E2E5